jgi:hypothetical protein
MHGAPRTSAEPGGTVSYDRYFVIPTEVENGASRRSDMDSKAARAARESRETRETNESNF